MAPQPAKYIPNLYSGSLEARRFELEDPPYDHSRADPKVKFVDRLGKRPNKIISSARKLINGCVDIINDWGIAEACIGEVAVARRRNFDGIMSNPVLIGREYVEVHQGGKWCRTKKFCAKAFRWVTKPINKRLPRRPKTPLFDIVKNKKKTKKTKLRKNKSGSQMKNKSQLDIQVLVNDGVMDKSEDESKDESVTEVKENFEGEVQAEIPRAIQKGVDDFNRKVNEYNSKKLNSKDKKKRWTIV